MRCKLTLGQHFGIMFPIMPNVLADSPIRFYVSRTSPKSVQALLWEDSLVLLMVLHSTAMGFLHLGQIL